MLQIFWNSVANARVPVALLRRIPNAMPIAAATPMAGAPRITMVLMAFATSLAVRHLTQISDPGNFRWSIMTTASSCQSMVGSIFPSSYKLGGERERGRGANRRGTCPAQERSNRASKGSGRRSFIW